MPSLFCAANNANLIGNGQQAPGNRRSVQTPVSRSSRLRHTDAAEGPEPFGTTRNQTEQNGKKRKTPERNGTKRKVSERKGTFRDRPEIGKSLGSKDLAVLGREQRELDRQ